MPTVFTAPTLTGERVVLRPFTPADVDAMGPVLADPDVLRLTGSVHTTAEATGARPELDEATRLVLAHAFTATDLYRVELGVYAFNPRARHVYERAGFVVEGTRRAALVLDGERVDEVTMAVLRPQWLAARGGPASG